MHSSRFDLYYLYKRLHIAFTFIYLLDKKFKGLDFLFPASLTKIKKQMLD